jgi:hypothetical protein
VKFQIGDTVQVGTRVGTITDVGTVLIEIKTNDGCLRMTCPWEVVPIPSQPRGGRPSTVNQRELRVGRDRGATCARSQLGLGDR